MNAPPSAFACSLVMLCVGLCIYLGKTREAEAYVLAYIVLLVVDLATGEAMRPWIIAVSFLFALGCIIRSLFLYTALRMEDAKRQDDLD